MNYFLIRKLRDVLNFIEISLKLDVYSYCSGNKKD